VYPELVAILALQEDDEAVRKVEGELASVMPRIASLDKARQRAQDECARADATLARETERFRSLEARVTEHRDRHEKNVNTLNQAHKLREATAAMAQVESAKRVVAEDESELLSLSRRLTDLRTAATLAHEALATLQLEQAEARAAIESERAGLGKRISDAQAKRMASAQKVTPSLLNRYDRMNTRRKGPAVFALHHFACGNCDTAVSMQRRPALSTGNVIETCEGCGVLLYFVVPTPAATTA
jgi:predicted  nucleic acid-binding Zn-ribbon protein